MKINNKKLLQLYKEEVNKSNNFTMWFDSKTKKLQFNNELQTRVERLNEMEQWTFLKMVLQMFMMVSMDRLGKLNVLVEGGVK
jgi:hypothetical protein